MWGELEPAQSPHAVRPDTRPAYLVRTSQRNLLADSLAELAELVECAHENGDHIELLVAYYPTGRPLDATDLDGVLRALQRSD